MSDTLSIPTSEQCQFIDITAQVQQAIRDCGIDNGLAVIFVPHTTAGITINESADPDVPSDILAHLEKMVPQSAAFRHREGNSPAHIKAGLMGSSITVMVSGGKLDLGTWQGIFLCEFDGPRTRKVRLRTIGE